MLTEDIFKINFLNGESNITRNSNCTFGGDVISIFVNNPREKVLSKDVTGVEFKIVPHVPGQDLGGDEVEQPEMTKIEKFEDFDLVDGIYLTIQVVPEYSYRITASYITEMGRLSPSDELNFPGDVL